MWTAGKGQGQGKRERLLIIFNNKKHENYINYEVAIPSDQQGGLMGKI